MHVEERVDEEPTSEVGGVAADLPALETEDAVDGVVVEIGVDIDGRSGGGSHRSGEPVVESERLCRSKCLFAKTTPCKEEGQRNQLATSIDELIQIWRRGKSRLTTISLASQTIGAQKVWRGSDRVRPRRGDPNRDEIARRLPRVPRQGGIGRAKRSAR